MPRLPSLSFSLFLSLSFSSGTRLAAGRAALLGSERGWLTWSHSRWGAGADKWRNLRHRK